MTDVSDGEFCDDLDVEELERRKMEILKLLGKTIEAGLLLMLLSACSSFSIAFSSGGLFNFT